VDGSVRECVCFVQLVKAARDSSGGRSRRTPNTRASTGDTVISTCTCGASVKSADLGNFYINIFISYIYSQFFAYYWCAFSSPVSELTSLSLFREKSLQKYLGLVVTLFAIISLTYNRYIHTTFVCKHSLRPISMSQIFYMILMISFLCSLNHSAIYRCLMT